MPREFRVDISRPLAPSRMVNGLEVFEDTGLNYVDCYFPDGSQKTWGYIGRTPQPGEVFAPLSGCKPALAIKIQDEINKMLGATVSVADIPPLVDEEQIDGDDEYEESDDE
jgi:hypothetical protein